MTAESKNSIRGGVAFMPRALRRLFSAAAFAALSLGLTLPASDSLATTSCNIILANGPVEPYCLLNFQKEVMDFDPHYGHSWWPGVEIFTYESAFAPLPMGAREHWCHWSEIYIIIDYYCMDFLEYNWCDVGYECGMTNYLNLGATLAIKNNKQKGSGRSDEVVRPGANTPDYYYRDMCINGADLNYGQFDPKTGELVYVDGSGNIVPVPEGQKYTETYTGKVFGSKPYLGSCMPLLDTDKVKSSDLLSAAGGFAFYKNADNDPFKRSGSSANVNIYGKTDTYLSSTFFLGGIAGCPDSIFTAAELSDTSASGWRTRAEKCYDYYIYMRATHPEWTLERPGEMTDDPLTRGGTNGDPDLAIFNSCQPLMKGSDAAAVAAGTKDPKTAGFAPVLQYDRPDMDEADYNPAEFLKKKFKERFPNLTPPTFNKNAFPCLDTSQAGLQSANQGGTTKKTRPADWEAFNETFWINYMVSFGVEAGILNKNDGPQFFVPMSDEDEYKSPGQDGGFCPNIEKINAPSNPFAPRDDFNLQDGDPYTRAADMFVDATTGQADILKKLFQGRKVTYKTSKYSTDRDYSYQASLYTPQDRIARWGGGVDDGWTFGYDGTINKVATGNATEKEQAMYNWVKYPPVQCAIVPVDILESRRKAFDNCIMQRINYNFVTWRRHNFLSNVSYEYYSKEGSTWTNLLNVFFDGTSWLSGSITGDGTEPTWTQPCKTRFYETDKYADCPVSMSIQQCCRIIVKDVVPMNYLKIRTCEGLRQKRKLVFNGIDHIYDAGVADVTLTVGQGTLCKWMGYYSGSATGVGCVGTGKPEEWCIDMNGITLAEYDEENGKIVLNGKKVVIGGAGSNGAPDWMGTYTPQWDYFGVNILVDHPYRDDPVDPSQPISATNPAGPASLNGRLLKKMCYDTPGTTTTITAESTAISDPDNGQDVPTEYCDYEIGHASASKNAGALRWSPGDKPYMCENHTSMSGDIFGRYIYDNSNGIWVCAERAQGLDSYDLASNSFTMRDAFNRSNIGVSSQPVSIYGWRCNSQRANRDHDFWYGRVCSPVTSTVGHGAPTPVTSPGGKFIEVKDKTSYEDAYKWNQKLSLIGCDDTEPDEYRFSHYFGMSKWGTDSGLVPDTKIITDAFTEAQKVSNGIIAMARKEAYKVLFGASGPVTVLWNTYEALVSGQKAALLPIEKLYDEAITAERATRARVDDAYNYLSSYADLSAITSSLNASSQPSLSSVTATTSPIVLLLTVAGTIPLKNGQDMLAEWLIAQAELVVRHELTKLAATLLEQARQFEEGLRTDEEELVKDSIATAINVIKRDILSPAQTLADNAAIDVANTLKTTISTTLGTSLTSAIDAIESQSPATKLPLALLGEGGAHMPYMRWWDTGTSAGNPVHGGSFINTLGSYDTIIGVGREERDIFDAYLDSGAKLASLVQQQPLTQPSQMGRIGGWNELKAHQMWTTRLHNLSCIGRYEKLFKLGGAEDFVLAKAGTGYTTRGSTDPANPKGKKEFSWNLGWRGYVNDKSLSDFEKNGVVGMGNASAGDIVIYELNGIKRIGYVIAANSTEPRYVKIDMRDAGKFPTVTGNTSAWGSVVSKTLYKDKVPVGATNFAAMGTSRAALINGQPSCEDPGYTDCALGTTAWDNAVVYRPSSDTSDRACPLISQNGGRIDGPDKFINNLSYCVNGGFDPPSSSITTSGGGYKGAGAGSVYDATLCGPDWTQCLNAARTTSPAKCFPGGATCTAAVPDTSVPPTAPCTDADIDAAYDARDVELAKGKAAYDAVKAELEAAEKEWTDKYSILYTPIYTNGEITGFNTTKTTAYANALTYKTNYDNAVAARDNAIATCVAGNFGALPADCTCNVARTSCTLDQESYCDAIQVALNTLTALTSPAVSYNGVRLTYVDIISLAMQADPGFVGATAPLQQNIDILQKDLDGGTSGNKNTGLVITVGGALKAWQSVPMVDENICPYTGRFTPAARTALVNLPVYNPPSNPCGTKSCMYVIGSSIANYKAGASTAGWRAGTPNQSVKAWVPGDPPVYDKNYSSGSNFYPISLFNPDANGNFWTAAPGSGGSFLGSCAANPGAGRVRMNVWDIGGREASAMSRIMGAGGILPDSTNGFSCKLDNSRSYRWFGYVCRYE